MKCLNIENEKSWGVDIRPRLLPPTKKKVNSQIAWHDPSNSDTFDEFYSRPASHITA